MTSVRRTEANRRNARKSTGPRTRAGKAVVAVNGIKHGLFSREVLIKGESEEDLADFGKRLSAHLAPIGEFELLLADRIVSTAWRLRRAIALERMFFDSERNELDQRPGYYSAIVCSMSQDRMRSISRYEVTLERSFYRALREFQFLQATRQEEVSEAAGMEIPVSAPEDAA